MKKMHHSSGSRLLDQPVQFEQDFYALLDGLVDHPAQLVASARLRYTELHRPDHSAWRGRTGLEQRWYASLVNERPDYTVYLDDEYLAEAWACWVFYSREALRRICAMHSLTHGQSILTDLRQSRITSVVDLGCGIGMTTAVLAELFSEARVIGTNLSACSQYDLALRLGEKYRFSLVDDIRKIQGPIDLLLASEYFEHFEEPVAHLQEVVSVLQPRLLLIANAFSVISTGHFPFYSIRQQRIPGRITGRLFNEELRSLGYAKVVTRLWNNRPAYWKRLKE